MNNSEQIIKAALAKWQAEISGCECGGSGETCTAQYPDLTFDEDIHPCPTCAPARAFVKKWCWHEWEDYINPNKVPIGRQCRHCNIHTRFIPELPSNPDLTTVDPETGDWLVKTLLMDLGLWNSFEDWHYQQVLGILFHWKYNHRSNQSYEEAFMEISRIAHRSSTEIISNGKLLCDAVESFVKEV